MQGPRLTANQFIALTLNDEKLSMPVYLPGIRSEAECDDLGLWPLIYIWNVDRAACTFSLSVNGKAIAHLLEPFVPREDPAYVEIRDEAMKVISEASTQSVLAMVEKRVSCPMFCSRITLRMHSRSMVDIRGVSEITPGSC